MRRDFDCTNELNSFRTISLTSRRGKGGNFAPVGGLGDETATVVDDSGELRGCSSFELGRTGCENTGEGGGGFAINKATFLQVMNILANGNLH